MRRLGPADPPVAPVLADPSVATLLADPSLATLLAATASELVAQTPERRPDVAPLLVAGTRRSPEAATEQLRLL